ncbi:MAG: DUF1080 domain-containing protein, partial [Candidatus Dadabacteria bacterium]
MKLKYTFIYLCYLICFNASANTFPVKAAPFSIEGRWDITINMNGQELPSWLEVQHSGFHMLVGHFVGIAGSARPISRINFTDNNISFSIPPQWEQGENDLRFEGKV